MDVSIIKEQLNDCAIYKVVHEGNLIGSAWVGITDIVPDKKFMTGKTKTIIGFGINYEFHNKGLGKALLKEIIENETKIKTKYLKLGVYCNNEIAKKLYTGFGFVFDGIVGNNEHLEYMYKQLND